MSNEKIIMYDSPEAAQQETITGWVSSDRRFFGKDEDLARFAGCTHKTCECGKIMEKHYLMCEWCRSRKWIENYNAYPFEPWDGVSPVYDHTTDEFFFGGADEIIERYADDEQDISTVRLSPCKEEYPQPVDVDYWSDTMPENWDSLPKEVEDALKVLNEKLRESGAWSWTPRDVRTSIPS